MADNRYNKTMTAARHIAAQDFAPCAEAFIDRRNPNSEGKLNYSFIGPGVAQSAAQKVNIAKPHGFNVGGVSLPPGRINNLHLHFTAEVFIPAAGEWDFLWGNDGENVARIGRFDIFTIPTWIFRGFVNRGGDDAFMFAVLGGDDTGGIVWHPSVLANAERAGLILTGNNRVIDLQKGESLQPGEKQMPPMAESAMRQLPTFSPAAMERYIARYDNLQWRADGILGGGELAAALGNGMTSARHHHPLVATADAFSLEWLRLRAGESTGKWQTNRPQVAILFDGEVDIICGGGDDNNGGGDNNNGNNESRTTLKPRSIFSAPCGQYRQLCGGKGGALVLLVNGGGERLIPQWHNQSITVAANEGKALDADNRLSPIAVMQNAGAKP